MRQNFSWNLMGNVIYAGCQWAMLVVLAKLTNPEMVGRFALGLAITAPIFLFSQLQLRGVLATDAKNDYAFGHYLALRLVSTVIALLITTGISLIGGYGQETVYVILAIGVSKGFEAVSDVFYGLMQLHERMDQIALSRILKGTLSLAVMALILFLTSNVFFGVLGMAAVWATVFAIYDLSGTLLILQSNEMEDSAKLDWSMIKPKFEYNRLLQLAWLALPLGLVIAMISLNSSIPRYFIEKHFGEANLGIFAAIAYLMQVGSQVMGALGQSVTPRLAKYYVSKTKKPFLRLLFFLVITAMCIGFGGVIIASLFGDQILQVIYGTEYASRWNLFIWMMVAAAVSYFSWVIGVPLTAMRIFRMQTLIALLSLNVSFFSSFFLVASYGLIGAIISIIMTNTISIIFGSTVLYFSIQRTKWN